MGTGLLPLLRLALASAWHRRFVLGLIVLSIALSTFLLLAIERVRADVRDNFAQSVSGTDLIVGARGAAVPLMLQVVFRIGSTPNSMGWRSVQALAAHRAVAWTVPISLGDSHRGYPVVATSAGYFEHFRYGRRQPLRLAEGRRFAESGAALEAVLGAEVARRLGYRLGDRVVLSHGDGAIEHNDHADQPFTVVGILAPTGTPVDRSLHISLAGMEAIHQDWIGGVRMPARPGSLSSAPGQTGQSDPAPDLTPRNVTAVLVGLKTRAAVFSVQRFVADYPDEPLMGVLPGVALDELWQVVGLAERALQGVSALVAVVSLAGLMAVILAGLNERRRELAILRAVGCGPRRLLGLLALEGALVTALGVALGALAAWGAAALLADLVQLHWGLPLRLAPPGAAEWTLMGAVLAGGWLASLVPGWRAYRLSLADGLSPRA